MDDQDVFAYITSEANKFKTERIPLTNSKDWSLYEHIQRCTNVANAWYHSGNNDGLRPYDDLVTPIINVAFRSEGFDVKDIVPYVNKAKEHYKSFVVKKLHPQWARKNEIDTLIDEVVETSIITDLVIVKGLNKVRPEVVDLTTLAFADQTDVLSGPICIKHDFTIAELAGMKGKWDDEMIDRAIVLSLEEKRVKIADDKTAKTPGKYVEVFELRGRLPASWSKKGGKPFEYTDQMFMVCFYENQEGQKNGIILYQGKDKPLNDVFKVLKIDGVRSKGRAAGRSIVETLFEPQVWNNYGAIKLKELLDGAVTLFQTDSDEYKNQKLSNLKTNTVLSHETGKPITRIDGNVQNLTAFQQYQDKQAQSARTIGSASDAQLGNSPVSGTPFALQDLVVQQGQGIHEYRQGKIATFFADVLYPDLFLKHIIKDINTVKKFSEELSLEEMQEVADQISTNRAEKRVNEAILGGTIVTQDQKEQLVAFHREAFMRSNKRKFFETLKGELQDIPVSVMVNIKGKQKYMAQNADKLTKILREVIANPQAFSQIPGIGNVFNQLLENSGLSPIDFSQITNAPAQPAAAPQQ